MNFSWTVTARSRSARRRRRCSPAPADSFSTITQQFDFAGNPGASDYEIKYAKGGVVQPDGSLSCPALKDGFFDTATGKVELIGAREPGTYLVVARAGTGDYYSPWSAPVDLEPDRPVRPLLAHVPDSRGPSYQVRATSASPSAGGRVTVAVAKGKKGKRFRTLGKAKVNSKGVFKLRFRLCASAPTGCATRSGAPRPSPRARSTRSSRSAGSSASSPTSAVATSVATADKRV